MRHKPVLDDGPSAEVVVDDLAGNIAGQGVREHSKVIDSQAPIRNAIARLFEAKTEERAWRAGAVGEERVGRTLAKLDGPWRVLHSVPVGTRGSDIDHVVVGPPGVITINTKRHPRGSAWVGHHSLRVNGQPTAYLRNARFEGERAGRRLSAAYGQPVEVQAAIVFVDLDDFKLKEMPDDVYVTTRRRMNEWLESMPPQLDASRIDDIFNVARRRSTWV